MVGREVRKLYKEYQAARRFNLSHGFDDKEYPRSCGPLDGPHGLSKERVKAALEEELGYKIILDKYTQLNREATRWESSQQYSDRMFALHARLDEWTKNSAARRRYRFSNQ